jgi:RNA polymerase sigma-70 factor (ECF subfamily)
MFKSNDKGMGAGNMSTASDSEAIARYLRGDTEALSDLIEEYRRPLFGFIYRMVTTTEEAEEIFQEVWFKAIKNLSTYKHNRFLSWLFRIAHNLVIDRSRKQSLEVTLEDEDTADRLTYHAGQHSSSPVDAMQENDTHQRIQAAVTELPSDQREVFLMRMEADLPFKEIARIQKVSINTALARMTYAIEKLRKALAEDYAQLHTGA